MLEKIKTYASEVWAIRPNKREIAIIELSQLSAIFGYIAASREGNDLAAIAVTLFSFYCFGKAHMSWVKREISKSREKQREHQT